MPSKFSQFLEKNKIDARRLLAASRRIERLTPDDRALKLGKRLAKQSGTPPAEGKLDAAKKPRSGRPVTARLVQEASLGKPLAGPAKSRLLRAVNHILTQKKQSLAELKAIF